MVESPLASYTTLASRCRTVKPQSHMVTITKLRYLEAIVLDMRYPIGQDVKTICQWIIWSAGVSMLDDVLLIGTGNLIYINWTYPPQ